MITRCLQCKPRLGKHCRIIFFIIALMTKNRQSPHDLLAHTFVVRKNSDTVDQSESSVNIFDEMAKRGLKTYDEQLELMKELKMTGRSASKAPSYVWVGVVFLVFSIMSIIWFMALSYSDLTEYAQTASINNPRFKANGLQVDESVAGKYVGLWSSNDNKIGFRIYYSNGTLFINTSVRGLRFRFDQDNNLFVTDGNENEYKILMADDAMTMSRTLNGQLEMRYHLFKVTE